MLFLEQWLWQRGGAAPGIVLWGRLGLEIRCDGAGCS
jgi:hypothetical protein